MVQNDATEAVTVRAVGRPDEGYQATSLVAHTFLYGHSSDAARSPSPSSRLAETVSARAQLLHRWLPTQWMDSLSMTQPCIISVASTGSVPRKRDNPVLPVTAAEQIESADAAYEAGADVVHGRVCNDDGISRDHDKFAAFLEGVRHHCPNMIVRFATGGRGREPSAPVPERMAGFGSAGEAAVWPL